MVVFGGLLDVVIVVFLVLVFAEYAKLRVKADKAFKLLAGAALMFLLAASFAFPAFWTMIPGALYGLYLFEAIGWIFLLIGVIVGAVELAKGK